MGPKSCKHMLLLRSRRDATALPQGMHLLTAQMTSHEKHLQAFLAGRDCSEPVEPENRRGSHAGVDVALLNAVQHEDAAAVGAGENIHRHAK